MNTGRSQPEPFVVAEYMAFFKRTSDFLRLLLISLFGLIILGSSAIAADPVPGTLVFVPASNCENNDSVWYMPGNAAGKPSKNSLNRQNSAVWLGGQGSITCGGFKAADQGKKNLAATLRFGFMKPEASAVSTFSIDGVDDTAYTEETRGELVEPGSLPVEALEVTEGLKILASYDNSGFRPIAQFDKNTSDKTVSIKLPESIGNDLGKLKFKLEAAGPDQPQKQLYVDSVSVSYIAADLPRLNLDASKQFDKIPVFGGGEDAKFKLEVDNPGDGYGEGIKNSFGSAFGRGRGEPDVDISAKVLNDKDRQVKVKNAGTNYQGLELDGDQKWDFSFKPPANLKPGKYTAQVSYTDEYGNLQMVEQDFLWGVLAINTHKNIYGARDTVNFDMAVLNETGQMVCDADVELKIEGPSSATLSTKDDSIEISDQCDFLGMTENPDYHAKWKIPSLLLNQHNGEYKLTLSATTANGTYTISDKFFVGNTEGAFVERQSHTRIYPKLNYLMAIDVTTERDVDGVVTETVPLSFQLSKYSKVQAIFGESVEDFELEPEIIKDYNSKTQLIKWKLTLKKDSSYRFTYEYDPPDVSPEFYLLGPFKIEGNKFNFQEPRYWQIASDPTESKWADSHLAGTASTPTNANGATNDTWTNNTASWTSRWSMENPSASITGTQTINVVARKSAGGGGTPTAAINLYENGSLVGSVLADTNVTDTTSETLSGTFNAASITNPNNVEIEVVATSNGNGGGARHVHIDSIEWVANVTISVSGNVYDDETSTALAACTTPGGNMITMRVGGNTYGPVSCDGSTGAFSFSNVAASTGDAMVIYIDGQTPKGTTVSRYSGSGNVTGIILRKDRLVIQSKDGSAVTNTNAGTWDNDNDTDIVYTANTTMVVEDGIKLIVDGSTGGTNTSYTPGNTVTTDPSSSSSTVDGDILIESGATLNMGNNALSVGGDLNNSGTLTVSSQTTTFTATATGHTITTGSSNLANVTFNGASGGWSFAESDTITGTLTMTAGTLSGTNDLIVNGSVTGSSPISLTGGTFTQRVSAAQNFGTTSGSNNWTFNNLTFSNTCAANCTITTNTGGSGQIIVLGNLTVGNGSDTNTVTLDNNTNDRILDVDGSLDITSKGSLTASSSAAFTIAANFTNSGTFTHSNGEVTLDSATTATIAGATTFHSLKTTTAGKTIRFTAGQTFTVNGLLTITGSSGNNINIQSSDTPNPDPDDQWFINHQGTESVTYATIEDSGCDASSTTISANDGTSISDGNNGLCWILPIDIIGTAYEDETSTVLAACDHTTPDNNISLRVGGVTYGPISCNDSSGAFTFDNVIRPSAGDPLVIYIDNVASTYATTVSRYSGSGDMTGLKLRRDRLIMTSDHSSPVTNANAGTWDNDDDPDIVYTSNSNNLVLEDGFKLLVEGRSDLGSASWYDIAWDSRKLITIDNTKVSGSSNLTDFPVLVSITNTDLTVAQVDGDDFVFTSSNGTTKLSHEIEKWDDSTGELIAWVKVPTLDFDNDTEIYIYYENSGATNQQDVANVWDSNYRGVWHLGEDVTDEGTASGVYQDSTSNNKHGNQQGPVETASGKIGYAQDLDGTNDYIEVPSPGLPTGAFTYEAWVKSDQLNNHVLFMAGGTGGTDNEFVYNLDPGNSPDGQQHVWIDNSLLFTTPTQKTFTTDYQHLMVTRNSSGLVNIYIDGTKLTGASESGTDNTTLDFGTCSFFIGTDTDSGCNSSFGNYVDGRIDEVRVSDTNRSDDWIATQYNNQNSPSTFYTLGGEQTILIYQPGGTVTTSVSTSSSSIDGDIGIEAGSKLAMESYALSVGGDFNNAAYFTVSDTQTTTFTATATGHTITTGESSFQNVTLDPDSTSTSGGWSFSAADTVLGTLTVTDGTLTGSNDLTVNGDVTGNGPINITSGTFTQRVSAAQNFGTTSGANNWTFNNLTFSNSDETASSPHTVSTNSGGTGQIIVSGTMTVGNASDTNTTTLDNETSNDRDIDINGSFVIATQGVYLASSTASFTIADDFTNNGTFTPNTGEVILDSTTEATITGDGTAFFDFTSTTAGKDLKFVAGHTFTIGSAGSGLFNINAASISSDTGAAQWFINHQGTESVSVSGSVSWSGCDGASTDVDYSGTDGGNNGTCWVQSANSNPNTPTSLAQLKTDDTVIVAGDWTNESSVKFTASATDTDNPDNLQLCIEVDEIGTAFSGTEDSCGSAVAYNGSAVTVTHTIALTSPDGKKYHWQARIKDDDNAYSDWVSYSSGSTVFLSDTFTDVNATLLASHDPDIGGTGTWEAMGFSTTGTPGSDLEISNNVLIADSLNSGQAQDQAPTHRSNIDPGTDNYDIEATMRFRAGAQAQRYHWLTWRMGTTDTTHSGVDRYMLVGDSTLVQEWKLYKVVGGTLTELDSAADDLEGNTFEVRVEVRDSLMTVFVDGVVMLSSTDTSITQRGRVGIGSSRGSSTVHYIDNLLADGLKDFGVDTTNPSGGTVYDGPTAGVDAAFNETGSLSELKANWSEFTDASSGTPSGIVKNEYSIGTTQGGTDIKTWTDNTSNTSVTATGLTLQTSQMYYFNVRATDNAGNISSVVSSDGQSVLPTLEFSVSPTNLAFDQNLNAGNSYTQTKDTTLTTSTNAYAGYVIRAWATDNLFTADDSTSIPWHAGTWDTPVAAGAGYGYSSNDPNVAGNGDIFSSFTNYAPFVETTGGEIVADTTTLQDSGTPITDQDYIIRHRVQADAAQTAGIYDTTIIYIVTAEY